MVDTFDCSNRAGKEEFKNSQRVLLDIAQESRKQFLDTRIRNTFEHYAKDVQINPSQLDIKFRGALDFQVMFDAILYRKDKLFKKDIAHFIPSFQFPARPGYYFLEVTVCEFGFREYATSIADDYEKRFDDKTIIILRR